MSELIIYLIKANIALALFYIGFRFGLRNLTFYKLNRYYLLFAFIFSSAYPLINWTNLFLGKAEIPKEVLSIVPDWYQLKIVDEGIKWDQIVEIFFWVSVVVFVFGLLIKLSGVLRIHLNSVPSQWAIYPYRKSKEDIVPFSFWKNIYLNPSKHKEIELDKIFKHEYIHVCQLHSLDILIAETSLIFFWYNPVCWLLRRDIRENIEFITDQKVLSLGVDKQSYQYSLLNISTIPNQAVLGNYFNLRNLKKRIMMMNKKQTSKTHLSKYVFIVPVVIICSLIFGITKAKENKAFSSVISEALNIDPVSIKQDVANTEQGLANTEQYTSIKEKTKIKTTPVSLKQDTSVKKETKKIRVIGVSTIKPDHKLSPLIDTLDNGALNLTKLGDWGKGTTVIDNGALNLTKLGDYGKRTSVIRLRKDSTKGEPLYIIDGQTMSTNPLMRLKPENIESISVLKDESATTLYGPEGKNGVILITTKAKTLSGKPIGSNTNNTNAEKSMISGERAKEKNDHIVTVVGYKNSKDSTNSKIYDNVLFILDGEKISKETFDKIDKESIESVSVFKDVKSIERYGEKGKNGVVEIITKKSKK